MKCENPDLPNARNVEQLTAQNVKAIAELEKAAHVQKTLSDRIADAITRFCGSMSFLWVHVAWFALWIGVNVGMGKGALDPFPFNFLTLIVSLEAIFLSTFILISENRQSRVDERRSHLDLQINMLSEQENTKMLHMLAEISKKLGIDANDQEVELLKQATKPEALVDQIDKIMAEKPSEK